MLTLHVSSYAGKCLTTDCLVKPQFELFIIAHGVNTLTMADFKLPTYP